MIGRHEGHISAGQGAILLFTVLTATLFLQYPAYLVRATGPSAWQASIIMTLVGLLLFLPVSALGRRFPGMGLGEIAEAAAGPVVGPILTLLVAVWLMFEVTLTLRNFTETFIVAILPRTPPSMLILVVAGCAGYASYRGLEPLSRAVQVLFPPIVLGAVFVLAFSVPRAQVSFLYPFWGHGPVQTGLGGLYYSSIAADSVVLLSFGYAFREGKGLRRAGLLSILGFGLLTTLTALVLVSVFGAPDAGELPFPMFLLSRMVYWGRFMQRIEAVVVMFWFYAAAVRLSACFHAMVVSVGGALRLPHYRPLVFPLLVVAVSMSLLPKDFMTVLRQERDFVRPLGFAVLGVVLLLLLVAAIRGKGGSRHAA